MNQYCILIHYHELGLKKWLKSFGTRIIPASTGCGLDIVLLDSILNFIYVEDFPDYFDRWGIDVISIFRWEGHSPGEENFKEDFLQKQNVTGKHNALIDAHVARDMYLMMEAQRENRSKL